MLSGPERAQSFTTSKDAVRQTSGIPWRAHCNETSTNRMSFKRKLILTVPLSIGSYLLVRGWQSPKASNNPDYPMVGGIVRGLLIMEGLLCLVVFLYTYVKFWRAERSSALERG